MKKEDAEKLAREFLQKVGFTDLVKEEESALMWNVWNDPNVVREDPDESFADGWVFHYAPGVDGVSFPSFGIEAEYLSGKGFFIGMDEPIINFNRMDLIYYRVSDPKDKERFTYVPAWKLRRNTNDMMPFSFVINAMDGSVVDDWDSEWQITTPKGVE